MKSSRASRSVQHSHRLRVENSERFELQIADAGYNSQFILAHREPILSPAWSPDGTLSPTFHSNNAGPSSICTICSTALASLEYEASNSAPAWMPDSQRLGVVLS
jgi:TolB protein